MPAEGGTYVVRVVDKPFVGRAKGGTAEEVKEAGGGGNWGGIRWRCEALGVCGGGEGGV